MRRTTAVSILALGGLVTPAYAQQSGTLEGNLFGQQGQVFQAQPQFDNQTIFYDSNTGLPIAPQPNFGQPLPQQDFGQQPLPFPQQPQPQQNFGQQPQFVPQPQQPSFGEPLPQFQPQPQPSFSDQQQFQPQQPSQFQPAPGSNTLGLAPPQPEQPTFAPEQPFRQPQNGSVLPQPGVGYNPPQPSTVPQFPAQSPEPSQQQGNVPYYDRARPAPQPQPTEPPSRTAGPEVDRLQPNGDPLPPPQTSAPAIANPSSPVSPAGPLAPGSDRAPTMAAELDELLSVGERYRAASPGFLEDLKTLARKYRDPLPQAPALVGPPEADPNATDLASTEPDPSVDPNASLEGVAAEQGTFTPSAPSGNAVTSVPPLDPGSTSFAYLEDYFTDGEIQNDPPWRIRQGDWAIDPTYGLRAKAPEQVSNAPIRPKELLKVLLTGDAPDADSDAPKPQAALIESQNSIGNAFSLGARIVDHAGKGTAHFIMHQGGSNWLGYRLELRSGPQPVVVLTRRGSNGYKDITKVSAPAFTTGKQHELRWARLSDGQMIVLLNNRPIITSRDTVFREDWKGFAFFNAGGDVSIRALRISAPVER